jgi:diguanylate cyclase
MRDKPSPAKQDDIWRNKYNAGQDELRLKEKQWRDTEKLVQLLVSRLVFLVQSTDKTLVNNLQLLVKALRDGQSILQLNKLIQDISNRILQLENTELKSSVGKDKSATDAKDAEINLLLVYDVVIVLLETISFPSAFCEQIKRIKKSLLAASDDDRGLHLLAGVTALAEVLDEVFYNIKHDKQKFGLFLQQINSDLQSLDADISRSSHIQLQRLDAEATINKRVESEVIEMENIITTQLDIEQFKQSVQGSMKAIRDHMETFKQQTEQHNHQSSEMMKKLRRQLQQMEGQCESLKQQILEKHQQTLSDPLTGIRNRLAYEEAIRLEIDRHKRYKRPLTLLMMDLDHFKFVNDTYGHSAGDKVLQFVAKILAANIRSVDFLARYGGEEFVIILPELDIKAGQLVAAKICDAVQASKLKVEGNIVRMTISGGLAQIRKEDTAESLFERADTAMYLAKERGRNRCETE